MIWLRNLRKIRYRIFKRRFLAAVLDPKDAQSYSTCWQAFRALDEDGDGDGPKDATTEALMVKGVARPSAGASGGAAAADDDGRASPNGFASSDGCGGQSKGRGCSIFAQRSRSRRVFKPLFRSRGFLK